jgi:hypothetical protein
MDKEELVRKYKRFLENSLGYSPSRAYDEAAVLLQFLDDLFKDDK